MRPLAYIIVLTAALVLVPLLSYTVPAQSVPFDRNLCQQNCGSLSAGAGSSGGYANYYSCMSKCSDQFWKDEEKTTRKLKNRPE
jgi:hypothetical protein